MMATVGQPLLQPESGWKRYDDKSGAFKYSGNPGSDASTHYVGTKLKIEFYFTGTKIRWIGAIGSSSCNIATVIIDGVEVGSFSQIGTNYTVGIMQFENLTLSDGLHKVTVVNDATNGGSLVLDAIDIDSTGRLFHPDEVTSITELEVGKRIRCNYVSNTAGMAGEFKNIGDETSDFISISSVPSVPNGDFYFIVADEYNGKKILIADRNIQSSISWDALNSNGLVFGVQKDLGVKNYTFIYRLLTGGINATDKDNEWDKYIVNSTLNGKIIAGDNNVWNYSGGASWTSTTNSAGSVNRTGRGASGNAGASGYNPTSYVAAATATGFRPLMAIEILPMIKSFIHHDGAYKKCQTGTVTWNTISATLPVEDTFINDGMDDLSVLDRNNKDFVASMSANGSLGSGKLFKGNIDLKKYFEIINVSVK